MKAAKGTSIIEILAVIVVVMVLLLPLSELLVVLSTDIPMAFKLISKNTTLLNAVDHLRQDVKDATMFEESFAGINADDKNLLIRQPDKVIRYGFLEGRIVREQLSPEQNPQSKQDFVWDVPNAVIDWSLRGGDNKMYALELHTGFTQKNRGRDIMKFANSYVFFINTLNSMKNELTEK